MSQRPEPSSARGTAGPTDVERPDPRTVPARKAERRAYEHYGLEFTNHRVEVPALDTHVRVATVGSGPPVVLVPGGLGYGVIWTPLLPELEGYTAYVVDRPGSGFSGPIDHRSAPLGDIAVRSTAAVFDHFDLDDAPLVGSSMGGLWALRFALARPERVSSLGLLGCPALFPGTSAPLPMRLVSVPVLGPLLHRFVMQPTDVDDARGMVEFLGHPPETVSGLARSLMEAWYRMERQPDARQSWLSLLQQAVRVRGAVPESAFTDADLRGVQVPVSLLWGRDDPFGSLEQGRRGAAQFPESTFLEVGVGHLPWFDDPARCGELLKERLTDSL